MTGSVRRLLPAVFLIGAAAAGLRARAFVALDRVLPLGGLYVDEESFTHSPVIPGGTVFARPPGMYAAAWITGAAGAPLRARVVMSLVSLLPAVALLAFTRSREDRRWAMLCAGGLALSPMLALSGMQVLPEVPAAALAALALLASSRRMNLLAGFLLGTASLFRAELLFAVPVLLLLSVGKPGRIREWATAAAGCLTAAGPVLLLNLLAGGGPVMAANGTENLWLGTSWELVTTPPGIEFEQLVSVAADDPGLQEEFAFRAMHAISADPGRWAAMSLHKALAFLTIPGPGRNLETGWVLGVTGLSLMLPLSFAAFALGGSRCFRSAGRMSGMERLAVSMLAAGLISAVIFFPSARFRTPVIPALWFLAASSVPCRRDLVLALPLAAVLLGLAIFYRYPGMERRGLTHLLSAENRILSGMPDEALESLDLARERGFTGADLENLRGIALSMIGSPEEGLACFRSAVAAAPASPTAWKNLAVSLWNLEMPGEASEAAMRAVSLNPLLRDALRPILGRAGDGPGEAPR
jgi:hypothetical protein